MLSCPVVADTTKVRIFKQITTSFQPILCQYLLLLIPQRYEFSSKSQPIINRRFAVAGCCWYHKGTNFQANHNTPLIVPPRYLVVADTTKVRIFKQITTKLTSCQYFILLLLIPQRYEFSSKSQLNHLILQLWNCCCWYHKGTNFQANHNLII